jgi:hypothetical protein
LIENLRQDLFLEEDNLGLDWERRNRAVPPQNEADQKHLKRRADFSHELGWEPNIPFAAKNEEAPYEKDKEISREDKGCEPKGDEFPQAKEKVKGCKKKLIR